jgi:outer membrane protein assembly factor BamB
MGVHTAICWLRISLQQIPNLWSLNIRRALFGPETIEVSLMSRARILLVIAFFVLSATVWCQQAAAPWPKFQGNSRNTGMGIGGGSNGQLRWSFQRGGNFRSSPAIAADGTIYITDDIGYVLALDSVGTQKWSFYAGYGASTAPAIGPDGVIYIGNETGVLYALSPAGEMKWSVNTGLLIEDSPALGTDGRIYIGSNDGNLYCIAPNGTEKWHFTTGAGIQSSPAIGVDGTIYIGSGDGNLYAIAPNGTQKWTFTTGGRVESSPVVGSDGTIYARSLDGYLYALNPDGSKKWRLSSGVSPYTTPALGPDGTVYEAIEGDLAAVNPDGIVKWSFYTGEQNLSSPVVGADGTVYFQGGSLLFAVSPNGTEVWSVPVPLSSSQPSTVSIAIGSDGALYLTSGTGGNLVAIGTEVNTVPIGGITLNPVSLTGGTACTGTVTLSQPAPSGGDVVSLTCSSSSVGLPAIVTVPAGATSATFSVTTIPVVADVNATIYATSGSQTVSAALNVQAPSLTGLTVSPSSLAGGLLASGTVTLDGPAPAGGEIISLSSSSASAVLPSAISVPGGATSATFGMITSAVVELTDVTITASLGQESETAEVAIVPATLQSLAMAPTSVVGGGYSMGTVTLTGPAPAGGLRIGLSVNSPSVILPFTGLIVPAGATAASFMVSTTAVGANTNTTITASLNQITQSANLTVLPGNQAVALYSVSVSPATVLGGSQVLGTVWLTGPAPTGGLKIALSSNSPSSILSANSVKVAAGESGASFVVSTKAVAQDTNATITATQGGASKQAALTIQAPVLVSLVVSPGTVIGNSSTTVTGTVKLSGIAPVGGLVVRLSSSSAAAAVPATVTVSAGQTTAKFTVSHKKVTVQTSATLQAMLSSSSASASLVVTP